MSSPMNDKELQELIVSTLWGKNYSELLKDERPVVDKLVSILASHTQQIALEARRKDTQMWLNSTKYKQEKVVLPKHLQLHLVELEEELNQMEVSNE